MDDAVVQYLNSGIDLSFFSQDYAANNDFLNFGKYIKFEEGKLYHLDEQGIPKVLYNGIYLYNPTTVAQYALVKYGKYINGNGSLTDFINAADKLISLQNSAGAFPYPFELTLYYQQNIVLPVGWISCLAQGQSLSVFSRAYHVTGDVKYILAGNAALHALQFSIENGGVMTTLKYLNPAYDNLIAFEEYPANPPVYTLNGFILTTLGLYDWANLGNADFTAQREIAGNLFNKSIKSITTMLPYFDIDGFSVYDLGYIVYKTRPNTQIFYHAFHIQLLHMLYSITQQDIFKHYEQLWQSYITPNTLNALTLDCNLNSPQLKGALLSFNANTHETNKYEYRFSIRNLNGQWDLIKRYSGDSSAILNTSSYSVGSYFIKVDIRDPGSTMDRKKFRIIKYDILPIPAEDVQLTSDHDNPAAIGSNITISAMATGGTGEYEYRFWLKSGDDWSVLQEYSLKNSVVFDTSARAPGVYFLQVDAKSKGSVLYREAAKVIEVDLINN